MKSKRQLRYQEFNDLVYLVMHCASLALAESRKEFNSSRSETDHMLDPSVVNSLLDCYARSHFRFDAGDDYNEYIDNQAFFVINGDFLHSFRNPIRQHIMIPFAFYSLILQNESNKMTVMRRANKVREATRNQTNLPSWKRNNPYIKTTHIFRPNKKDESQFSEILSTMQGPSGSYNLQYDLMISDNAKDAISYCSKLEKRLHILDYCGYTARCGLFLHDILKQYSATNTLDLIILMLCINNHFGTIEGCSLISQIYANDQNNPNMVMRPHSDASLLQAYAWKKTYGAYFKADDIFPVSIFYTGNEQRPNIAQKFRDLKKQKCKFQEYYSYIVENFSFEIPDFIDCFIDTNALECFVDGNDRLISYMKASSKLLKLLTEIDLASKDTKSILIASRLVNKYDDLFLTQANISEFYSHDEEIAFLAADTAEIDEDIAFLIDKP